jgi:hypothetical protein
MAGSVDPATGLGRIEKRTIHCAQYRPAPKLNKRGLYGIP